MVDGDGCSQNINRQLKAHQKGEPRAGAGKVGRVRQADEGACLREESEVHVYSSRTSSCG